MIVRVGRSEGQFYIRYLRVGQCYCDRYYKDLMACYDQDRCDENPARDPANVREDDIPSSVQGVHDVLKIREMGKRLNAQLPFMRQLADWYLPGFALVMIALGIGFWEAAFVLAGVTLLVGVVMGAIMRKLL